MRVGCCETGVHRNAYKHAGMDARAHVRKIIHTPSQIHWHNVIQKVWNPWMIVRNTVYACEPTHTHTHTPYPPNLSLPLDFLAMSGDQTCTVAWQPSLHASDVITVHSLRAKEFGWTVWETEGEERKPHHKFSCTWKTISSHLQYSNAQMYRVYIYQPEE